jgi:hypothetical protein
VKLQIKIEEITKKMLDTHKRITKVKKDVDGIIAK